MKLGLREVSKLLNVPDSTLTQWIKQRGLPARFIGGQYRVHRLELLEWATANKVPVSLDLFNSADADDEMLRLADALQAGGVVRQIEGANRHDVLRALVQVMPLPNNIDRDLLLRLFLAREASASTAVGDGIALPHVRHPMVLHVDVPMVTVCFLKTPVDFGAPDGRPVHVLFSLICPSMRSHLQLLAKLSQALHDAGFRQAVMRQATQEELLAEARRFDAAATAPTAEKAAR